MYVPAVLVDGVIIPLVGFILRPAGLALKVPPEVPVVSGPSDPRIDLQ